MSLVALLRTGTRGFAFSDGAISRGDRIVAENSPKIFPLNAQVILAAAGRMDLAGFLRKEVAALGPDLTFEAARKFVRDRARRCLAQYGPRSLAAELLGRDASGRAAIVAWDTVTGEEVEPGGDAAAYVTCIDESAVEQVGPMFCYACQTFLGHGDEGQLFRDCETAIRWAAEHIRLVNDQVYSAKLGDARPMDCGQLLCVTGAGRAYENIKSDGHYAADKYHGSAFREKTTIGRGGSVSASIWTTTGSFTITKPAGSTGFGGPMTVRLDGRGSTYDLRGRLKIGALTSPALILISPELEIEGNVIVTGLSSDEADITVEVQGLNGSGDADAVYIDFSQVRYTDQNQVTVE